VKKVLGLGLRALRYDPIGRVQRFWDPGIKLSGFRHQAKRHMSIVEAARIQFDESIADITLRLTSTLAKSLDARRIFLVMSYSRLAVFKPE
jgi:hypothetical protein